MLLKLKLSRCVNFRQRLARRILDITRCTRLILRGMSRDTCGQAALAAGTSIYSTQKQVAVRAAKAASAAKKRARTAESRQWKLEAEAAADRHLRRR